MKLVGAIFAFMLACCVTADSQTTPSGAMPSALSSGSASAIYGPSGLQFKTTTGSGALTLLVTNTSANRIVVNAFSLSMVGGTTNEIQFAYGTTTTTPCDTGTTVLASFYGLTTGAMELAYAAPSGVAFATPPATNLCVKAFDPSPIVTGTLTYTITP